VALGLYPFALAAGVLVTIPDTAKYSASTPCPLKFGNGAVCQTQAYLDDTTWTADNVLAGNKSDPRIGLGPLPGKNIFLEAFTAWNTSGGGQGWKLVDGTNGGRNDLNGTVSVSTFTAMSFDADPKLLGGVQVTWDINITSGLPALGKNQQFVWAQALYDDTDFSKEFPVPPFFEMDITDNNCAPVYKCYFDPAGPFNDRVRLPFYGNFFEAETFYGITDTDAKTLTIFDGLDYGFVNTAPEPPAWSLMLGSLTLAGAIRKRMVTF
jgi:hypothetical protein